ncbi:MULTISPECIES: spermidine/putrescine ABC transporter permease PotB [Aeromonas]|uniref:spermidine/putrescine ABC transporter permease PotB n=1 Tax=Aeromonas TaxID=642 RepID=UPI00067C735C|nr:spermidine/putrescine ABC transporter permease PotB [Aeromonas veronii]QNF13734.1 spermidine/putrescine ABC transporter permease PotB [Aeromonas jandaei]EKP0294357.1 spermidine/putrescine ABC transporter permease PotB [Aeromonas veronii]KAB0673786.1 spermidine/putrescine ABC transporter permease PotB [Aeromonas veronii]MBL0591808.1 spermidine/putrescine ABC transporter permease PotB [Aeromonas veronii]MCF5870271.1 spermidine/putrescine ABC transporter permease PotB [Aeromonas veronii]
MSLTNLRVAHSFAHNGFRNGAIALILGWLTLFVFLPNLMIIGVSFLTRDESELIAPLFTLSNYGRLLDPLYFEVLLHSLWLALLATSICLLVGYPFAWLLAHLPARIRPLLLFLVVVPFWTNSLIRTYALKVLLGTRGLINGWLLDLGLIERPLQMMYTEVAVIIGLVYVLLPFMVLPLYSSIEKLDGRLLEAARDLGANGWQRLVRIILPLTLPGIIAGCLLVFLPAMGMFYVSDLLGGAKHLLIGNLIKTQFLNSRDWPFGAAISVMLTVLMALLVYCYWRAGKLLSKKGELA